LLDIYEKLWLYGHTKRRRYVYMLTREDIEDIFEMYFMGMSPDEINDEFQGYGVGVKDGKIYQEYEVPKIDVVHILQSPAVVGKGIVTVEMFDMVQKLIELDKFNDESEIKLSRMEQIYTILDEAF